MKSFKELLEDIRLMSTEGEKAREIGSVKGFTVNHLHLLKKPLLSRGDLDLYQIHHGEPPHRGYGLFLNNSYNLGTHGTGGAFIVHNRNQNKFVGVMEYVSEHKNPKELHIQYLKSALGPHKGIRNMIYDHATDQLGYTLVSDSTHTQAGKRGWEKDIRDGKNIHVRYIRRGLFPIDDKVEEIPAKHVLPIHIWSDRSNRILKPNLSPGGYSTSLYDESDVLLVRRPKTF